MKEKIMRELAKHPLIYGHGRKNTWVYFNQNYEIREIKILGIECNWDYQGFNPLIIPGAAVPGEKKELFLGFAEQYVEQYVEQYIEQQ